MRVSQKKNRRNILIGLCLVLLLMAVGFATFSNQLTINGNSNITSSWCVGFDSSNHVITPSSGPKTATAPSGTITYPSDSCGAGYKLGSTLSATLNQPGDSVEYTLSIKNASSLDAKIDSINVEGSNVTSNVAIKKGNVTFSVKMPESTSISAGSSTTMKITATFQNLTDITTSYSGESQNLSVSLNASQDNGSGGVTLDTATFGGQTVTLSTSGDGLYYDSNTSEYYYRGANPDNYIEFNNEVWRILSINSSGNIKIIKDERIGQRRFDATGATGRRTSGYCSNSGAVTYGCNAWAAMDSFTNGSISGAVTADSELRTYLEGTYKESLTDIGYVQTGMTWNVGPAGTYNDTNSISTIQSMERTYTVVGDIALATKSEYMRANSNPSCLTAQVLYNNVNTNNCRTSNYLWKSSYWFWLLSPYSGGTYSEFYASGAGLVISIYATDTSGSVRPVLFLKSNIILSGNGTNDANIYRIS